MIDDDKREEQLEEEQIVVDLPEEKSEGIAPEEPSNTKAPVAEQETAETEDEEEVEEESKTESEDEEEADISEDADESKDKKVFGKRAEKRIKRLVKEKKELESKLKELSIREQQWGTEKDELTSRSKDSELHAINQYIDRLKSQEKQSLSALKTAKEAGDIDAEINAQDALASVKAESLVARQYKMKAESDSEGRKVKPKTKPQVQSAAPDRKALEWQKRNDWFGSTTTKDRIMTQAAMVIHKELIEEGIMPNNSPEEYYNELDSRIREEFPDKFKNRRTKKIPTVISGTRSAVGKNQVQLTKTEVDMANRLGVSLQDYARQKQRQQAGG
jgi:hypothetical protein